MTANPLPTVVHVAASLEMGGMERMLVDLLTGLKSSGNFQPVLVTLREKGVLAADVERSGIPVHNLNHTGGVGRAVHQALESILQSHSANLIHSHNNPGLTHSAFTKVLSKKPLRHINTKHGVDAGTMKMRVLTRLAYLATDTTVAVSTDLLEYCRRSLLLPKRRLATITNGIDVDGFSITREAPSAHSPVIGHIARLEPVKNQALLLAAFERYLQIAPAAKLIIVGDGSCRTALQQLAKDLGIDQSVEFAGLQKDVKRYLARMDCFTLTSISEGTPISVLEALAAGLPITASRVGGLPEIVANGHNGFLFDPDSKEDCVAKWQQLFSSQEKFMQYSCAAVKMAAERFSKETMVREYEVLYSRLSTTNSSAP